MTKRPTYLFAGGGTGGHLFPGIAVAEELQKQQPESKIVFIGSVRTTEQQIIERYQFTHHALPTETTGSLWKRPYTFCRNNLQALLAADKILKAEQPRAVIGLGGFASVPVILAAARLRFHTLLLEQNAIPGRATRWLRRYANRVCLTFPESARYLADERKLFVTGNPLRRSISSLHRQRIDAAHQTLSPPHFAATAEQAKTLLVMGGSQGAQAINHAFLEVLPALQSELAGWQIVHQTGYLDYQWVQQRYQQLPIAARVEPFLNDLDEVYRTAQLAVTRAGATTLTELACVGCPAIVIPYPHASDNHQLANARNFAEQSACRVIEQTDKLARSLQAALQTLLVDTQMRTDLQQQLLSLARPNAANEICELIGNPAA